MNFWQTWFQFMASFLGTATAFSPFLIRSNTQHTRHLISRMAAVGIKVSKPLPGEVEKMQIKSWSTWGCGESKFPWTYSDTETAYMIKGKVIVTPDNKDLPAVTLERGDLAIFPAGMSCTWEVQEAISKYYKFN